MTENQRSSKRYECRVQIEYVLGEKRRLGMTRNLSLGGVYIESDEKVPYGAKLQIRLAVTTQKEAIEVGGQIRWVEPGGFGVQFDGLRARDVWALGKFFESRSGS